MNLAGTMGILFAAIYGDELERLSMVGQAQDSWMTPFKLREISGHLNS